jgi:hypothetical protein
LKVTYGKSGSLYQSSPGSHKPYYSRDFFYENQEKNAQAHGRTLNLNTPLSVRCLEVGKGSLGRRG